ncbi:MAG TPA: ABC transporter permease subunit [Phycisphaerae bacterium]|jgi:ABC-2 type transport system permease protein|nr:ABC transporter permease subunit [Phycisphaerae bacterium]
MSRAVVLKTLRDALPLVVVLTFATVGLEMAIVRMLREIGGDVEQLRRWLELPLIRDLLRIAMGADILGDLTPTTMATFGLGHPLLYAFAWTLLLTIGSGVIAGEIDRGTADLLLTLPVSRAQIYVSTSVAWVVAAVLVSFAPMLGLWLGERLCPLHEPLALRRLWPLAVNFLALNLSVGAVTMLVSSLVSRRGTAVGILLAGLLASDLMNFLSQFWESVRPFSFLGFLHYYRLLPVVRSGEFPAGDIAVLLAIGLGAWSAGLWHFGRRDIPAA